jgi:hypothetical protein
VHRGANDTIACQNAGPPTDNVWSATTMQKGESHMANEILHYQVNDEIAFIEMNRPNKLNALNSELSDALDEG